MGTPNFFPTQLLIKKLKNDKILTITPKGGRLHPTQFGEMTKRFLTTQVASLRQTVSRRTNVKTQHAFRTAEISIHPTSTVAAARLHALFTFARVSDTALSLVITPTPPITSVNPCCYRQGDALGGGLRLAHGRKIPFLISHTIKYCALTKRAYRWFARLRSGDRNLQAFPRWFARLRSGDRNFSRWFAGQVALRRSQLFALVCRPGCAQAIAPYGTFRGGMSYKIQ